MKKIVDSILEIKAIDVALPLWGMKTYRDRVKRDIVLYGMTGQASQFDTEYFNRSLDKNLVSLGLAQLFVANVYIALLNKI